MNRELLSTPLQSAVTVLTTEANKKTKHNWKQNQTSNKSQICALLLNLPFECLLLLIFYFFIVLYILFLQIYIKFDFYQSYIFWIQTIWLLYCNKQDCNHLRQNWSLQLKQQSMLLMCSTLFPDILPSTTSQLKPLLIGRFSSMSQSNCFSL